MTIVKEAQREGGIITAIQRETIGSRASRFVASFFENPDTELIGEMHTARQLRAQRILEESRKKGAEVDQDQLPLIGPRRGRFLG